MKNCTKAGLILALMVLNLLVAGQVAGPLLTSGYSSTGQRYGHSCTPGILKHAFIVTGVLYDNGPVVNSPGTGQGGADESIVYDPLTLLAFPSGSPVWTADNFTVSSAGWDVDSISFSDIIPNAPVYPSNFSGYYVQIWDGMPGQPGSHIVWGDRITNRLISSTWSNIYRRGDDNPGSTSLAIFKNACQTPGLVLGPGEYWVEAQALAMQGLYTFTPPVTLLTPASGDAVQFNELTNTWEQIVNNSYPQGMPFIVYGETIPVNVDAGISALISPISGVGLEDDEQLSIKVKNFGTESISNIPVFYTLDGATAVFAIVPGPISPEAEVIFDFPQTLALGTAGMHELEVATQLDGDMFCQNDLREFSIWNYGTVENMQNTAVAACSGLFYDAGGPAGDYAVDDTLTMYFHPATDAPNARLEFTFEEFDLEYPYDRLLVYDGPTWQYNPLIGEYSGGMIETIGTIRSSDPSGSLTFRFISDGDVTRPGWKAVFHCHVPNDADLAVTDLIVPSVATQNTPSTYSVKVKNEGNLSQVNYSVKLYLSDNTELASADGISLDFNEECTFTLLASVPDPGPQEIYAKVILQGDQDNDNDATELKEIQVNPLGTGYIFIGTDNVMNHRLPVSYASLNSLSETIYYPEEIDMEGLINGLGYVYSFREEVHYAPLKIWMGETSLSDLTGGWIPSSQLTQVFDGYVNYLKGVDTLRVDFSTPYEYHGGNLVILVYRPLDYTQYPGNEMGPNLFQTSSSEQHPGRSRQYFADLLVIDPEHPRFGTISEQLPNTLLKFDVSMMSALKGRVFGPDNQPAKDAIVTVEGIHSDAISHSNGDYAINYIWPGSRMTKAVKYSYNDDSISFNFSGGTVDHDFNLLYRPFAFITGSIRPSDAPWNGLGNATITITGYDTSYSTTSNGAGFFLLMDVFGNTGYQIQVTHPEYEDYNGNFNIGAGTIDLGSIILNELTAPPQNIVAADNGETAHISWEAMTLDYTIQYDNDSVYYYLTSFSDNRESAIRFTPEGYPCSLKSAFLNVHDLAAASGNPAGSFKVKVYDDDGTNNLPGTLLGEILVTPGMDGWVQVDLNSLNITITSGEFYIAHAQVGSYPNYVEIGLDQSDHPENRSYSKPASWSPWALDLYYYHFMIRALVSGPSGNNALLIPQGSENKDNPDEIASRGMSGYSVYRLLAGQEDNASLWNNISYNQTPLEFDDLDWGSLSWGEYRYAVTTNYVFGVESNPGFSNVLQKNMFITATISIVTNTDYIPADAKVSLTCTDGNPEHVYHAVNNTSGWVTFDPFYRGTYRVQVTHHNFLPFDQVMEINASTPVEVMLTEIVSKPVFVNATNQDTLSFVDWYDPTYLRDFILDDGQADASFGGLAPFPVWFGNHIENNYQGEIISVDLFFERHPFASDEPVAVDFFGPDHNLLGTSEPFIPDYGQWMTVRVPDIQVTGNYYAMVHFNQVNGDSHYLGFDNYGPNTGSESGCAFDGSSWFTMTEFIPGLTGGAFMIRPVLNVGFQGMAVPARRSISSFMVYRLEPGQENNPDQWIFLDNNVIEPEYSDYEWQGLQPGDYRYAVNSMYSSGSISEYSFSNILNRTTLLLAPQDLAVEQTGPDQERFTWKPAEGYGLIGYEVFLDNMETPVATVTDTSYVFSGLNADVEYLAGVRAIYESGESNTATIPFTLVITGEEPLIIDNLAIYPNPARNVVVIEKAQGALMQIYSLTGEVVMSKLIDNPVSRINVEPLIEGTYILRISYKGEYHCRKLVIMN